MARKQHVYQERSQQRHNQHVRTPQGHNQQVRAKKKTRNVRTQDQSVRRTTQNRMTHRIAGSAIAVIGGGAAGLMAAVVASGALEVRQDGPALPSSDAHYRQVTLYEAQNRTGKPILVTGAGRCNITNAQVSPSAYRNDAFVTQAFSKCPPSQVMDAFSLLGLGVYEEDEGRCYPVTNRATTVVDVLRAAMLRAGVEEQCHRRVEALEHTPEGWYVCMPDGKEGPYAAVVIATGGKPAAHILPDDVPCTPLQPVLAPLKIQGVNLRPVNRMRARCILSYKEHSEVGEAMFRSDGISGIAAFNISRMVSPGDTIVLNLTPDAQAISDGQGEIFFARRAEQIHPRTWEDMCRGLFLPRVGQIILSYAGLSGQDTFDRDRLPDFVHAATHMELTVEGIADPGRAQVHRGGIDVSTIDPHTMELRQYPGLFVAGEGVDVDGPCGGYNLHWAWTSGLLAGAAAAQKLAQRKIAKQKLARQKPAQQKPAQQKDDLQ